MKYEVRGTRHQAGAWGSGSRSYEPSTSFTEAWISQSSWKEPLKGIIEGGREEGKESCVLGRPLCWEGQ